MVFDPTRKSSQGILTPNRVTGGLGLPLPSDDSVEPDYELLAQKFREKGERILPLLEGTDESLAAETLKYTPKVQDQDDGITYPGTMEAPVRDVTNFLFGQDMAILGFKWDEEGFGWSMDKLVEQWTEQPLWSNLLTAGLLGASIYFPVVKATKFGRLAKVGRFKYYDYTGLAGHNGEFINWAEHIKTPADEINILKLLGYIEKDATKISPSALATYRRMAYKDGLKARRWEQMAQLRRYDVEEKAMLDMMSKTGIPEEVAKTKVGAMLMHRGLSRPNVSPIDQAIHRFERGFGQQLWRIANDPSPQGQLRMQLRANLQGFYGSEAFGDFDSYKKMLTDHSTFARKFYQKMINEISPEAKVGKIETFTPEEDQVYGVLKSLFLNHQKQWVEEGLAPTGVPLAHLISLTKTGVPQGFVPNLVEASDMFRALYSPTMLKKKDYASFVEELEATWKRVESGDIQINSLDKLMQGYINDRMLLFNFRSMIDVLQNPKNTQYFNDLANVYKEKKYFPNDLIGLDDYFRDNKFPEGAEAIRNMLKKRISDGTLPPEMLGPNGELPYLNSWIHEAMFGEDGFWDQSEAAAINILEAMTAVHKTSKCLVGDTRVSTEKGYVKIKDLIEYKDGYHCPDFDFTVDTPNGAVVPLASYREKSNTIKVTFKDGSQLEGTPNHPILTSNGLKELQNLQVGDPIVSHLNGSFSQDYVKINWNIWKREIDNDLGVPLTITEDYAELIGWILGDGSIHDNSIRVSIGTEDYDWSVSRLSELCDRIGLNYTHTVRHRKGKGSLGIFSICCASFVKVLQHLGVDKKNLRIPEFIFQSPKSVVIGVLRGLLVTDGHVSAKSGGFGFMSKSEQLVRDVQLLLKWVGIQSSITVRKPAKIRCIDREYYSREYWHLRADSWESKSKVLEEDLIPMPRKKEKINLVPLIKKHSYVNKVVKIEHNPQITEVYDISLPPPHLFITNGLVSHNTAFNPGSHVQNILGNVVLLIQAGLNPFRSHNAQLLKDSTDTYKVIHNAQLAALKQFGTNAPNKDDVLIFVRRYLATHGKTITYKGNKINASELADPLVQQLYMEGSFDSAEGYGLLRSALGRKNVDPVTKKFIQGVLNASDNRFTRYTIGGKQILNETTGQMEHVGGININRVFTEASKWYMGEDIIPKIALYVKNRAEGASMNAAVREVATRLPMYGLTGTWIKAGRKWAFPWASFPSEITRITKNNLYDHPMRMLPWFKASNITQSLFAALGQGPVSAVATGLTERTLPLWGQTRDTVVTTSKEGTMTGAAAQSGLFGAAVGAAAGGPVGMAVGGAVGAAGAGVATYLSDDAQMENEIRGAVLGWLPHTAIMPKIDSPDYHYWNYDDVLHQIPAEPLAIFRGLMQIVEGRDSFGNPISGESLQDKMGKGVAQFIGFLAPPFIQKYGFQVTTPDVPLSDAVFGTHIPGDITNVRRGLVDTGKSVDALTGRPGGLILDLLLNNLGLWKSYRGFGENYLANQRIAEDKMYSEIRTHHSRQLRFHILNADDAQIGDIMRRIFNTFSEQYRDNPSMASQQFSKWVQRQLNTIGEHPVLKGLNKKELSDLIEMNGKKTGEIRSLALQKIVDAIKQERTIREIK